MTVQNSSLKCKDGDFAVVVFDTPDCRQNIGRVVQVRGPVRRLKQSGKLGWLIKPVHKRVWGITELDGRIVKELVFWKSWVLHPDAWLMPIRPQSSKDVWHEALLRIDQGLIDIGNVLPMKAPIFEPQEAAKAIRL
jgi:hypothetical protein